MVPAGYSIVPCIEPAFPAYCQNAKTVHGAQTEAARLRWSKVFSLVSASQYVIHDSGHDLHQHWHRFPGTCSETCHGAATNMVQILLTVGMWLACRRYHPSFGIPGTELPDGTPQQQIWWLGQGWEWWPTLAWQFIWSWIVAPYLLVKSWHIDDTMGWRTQTIGCCIAR